ncbi:GPW/gp25 family protein [Streptomyces netropsis]
MDITGAGWAFPTTLDPDGTITLADGHDTIERSIQLILATTPGERPLRPEFGCPLADVVFAPLNSDTAGRIHDMVTAALTRWEPRITVEDVQVLADDTLHGLLYIDLHYRINTTNTPHNLVYPYYTIPVTP